MGGREETVRVTAGTIVTEDVRHVVPERPGPGLTPQAGPRNLDRRRVP
ncbi:hypothetical protein GCM10010335_21020 [Streptomyces galbus]|nr:hypothetical protein GCM10010335_21020 [Streptomyces galbus]